MKAFLLAAGLGTRLRPMTDAVPKCLVPIAGRPLLEYWFVLFERHGVDEVLLNLHHLPEQVRDYLDREPPPVSVTTIYEEELLGSAGTVRANAAWIGDDETFLVAYADNFTDADLGAMIDAHRRSMPPLTLGLFRTGRPAECGIATLDDRGTVITFEEKPDHPLSDLANAGIYVAQRDILDEIPGRVPSDFGFDVLPRLLGRMKGHVIEEYLLDIGNLERYAKAQADVSSLSFGR